MNRFILFVISISIYANLFAQLPEPFEKLVHTPDSLAVTVWNNGLLETNPLTGGATGELSWNGINGIWAGSLGFGTQAVGLANGGAPWYYDMVNVYSNFAGGFTEETVGSVTFDQVSMTVIRDDNAQSFFNSYYKQGILKEKKTLQFYDKEVKMFLPDRYVEGICPKCGYEEARSDECENCGSLYDPKELKNPKSKITGAEPILKETSHWYFPLGKYQVRLEEYIYDHNLKYKWKDNVLMYCKGWFNEGLKDRAVTRDLDWGVKVPLENVTGKVMYVWFEAVLGYISATKEYFKLKGNSDEWRNYWQDQRTRYIAFIGKDNIVFHTIIFPAMLMVWNDGNDDKFILPENVPANEFLNFEGKKFSKSRGWGIGVNEFLDMFPADSLRYTLASNLPENKDTDFLWKDFQAKNNSELADILGNFVNRTFTFVHKHFDGKVPAINELSTIDSEMINTIHESPLKIGNLLENYKVKDATFEMMNLARAGNKYFNDSEPWINIKKNRDVCSTTLNICIQTIFTLAEVFYPVIPFTSEKILKMLQADRILWNDLVTNNLKAGHQLSKAEILFEKIEDSVIENQIAQLGKKPEENKTEHHVSIDEFKNIDLQIAEIIGADRIKKSKKLLKLKLATSDDKRDVIAGLAKDYSPEMLIGKKVVLVANLKPTKILGNNSQGMILAVENENGELKLLEVDQSVRVGAKVS
ncbi:methionine--tRNA ligase [Bacteroidota bacterium]